MTRGLGLNYLIVLVCAGTPIVMAPEVMFNHGLITYTAKADCWSLGVILYQLLSGHLPHRDGGNMTGRRWEEISDEAKDLVKMLIMEDPVKRLSAVQALQHIWFQGDDEVCREARNIMFDTEDSLSQVSGHYDLFSTLKYSLTKLYYKIRTRTKNEMQGREEIRLSS